MVSATPDASPIIFYAVRPFFRRHLRQIGESPDHFFSILPFHRGVSTTCQHARTLARIVLDNMRAQLLRVGQRLFADGRTSPKSRIADEEDRSDHQAVQA
jgi:hypothetical protein